MNRHQLINTYGDPQSAIYNKTVIQMYQDALREHGGVNMGIERLMLWAGVEGSIDAIRMKVKRLHQKLSKLRGQAKLALERGAFEFPEKRPNEVEPTEEIHIRETYAEPAQEITRETTPPRQPRCSPLKTPQKRRNLEEHGTIKKHKTLNMIEEKIKTANERLKKVKDIKGKYNIKNVKKREARNVVARTELRAEKRQLKSTCLKQEQEITFLREENERLKEQLKAAVLHKNEAEKFEQVKEEKRKTEKMASFHKRAKEKIQQQLNDLLEADLREDDERVREVKTTNGGMYTESVRLCVLELASYDVATGKIAGVMDSVARMCGASCSNLPSEQTCQNIIDGGQFIVQKIIAEKVKSSEGIGLHKDGTSRRKVKILDSTLQMSDGTSYCLGFSSVSAETGEAIAEHAKDKMKELSQTMDDEGKHQLDMIEKLKYFMNDRAGNEKKSSRLLEEWRRSALEECGKEEISNVHHLFCTAHVLIGFQNYTLKSLSHVKSAPGKHPILILLRDTSDLFAPVGDYRGCRDVWDAFCKENNMKSTIQNFKDNRFNGLFEVSAQVFHHYKDFIKILENATNNTKQQRFKKLIHDQEIVDILECLGLFFFKVTGPFWTFAVSKNAISQLPSFTQNLHSALQKVIDDPSTIFGNIFDFLKIYKISCITFSSTPTFFEHSDPKMSIVTKIASALKHTIEVQLSDMLPDGSYGDKAGVESLSSASFAPLNNLSCERNFGILDASQRRRPRATLHHHSSIIMLKQNRKNLQHFCNRLTFGQKKLMWAKAVKAGKELRAKHRASDKAVLMESLKKAFPQKRTIKRKPNRKNKNKASHAPPPMIHVQRDDLVAVACEDNWYPALVLDDVNPDVIRVDFAELGKNIGNFKWPKGKDVHDVSRRTVIWGALEVQPRAGGRSWVVCNAKEIQKKFKK